MPWKIVSILWITLPFVYSRFFGGLIDDIKRKAPFYKSDFKDAMHIQAVASFFFLYFACFTPIITFGGLLGDATGGNMVSVFSVDTVWLSIVAEWLG
jgi:hypothetical protein